MPEGKGLGRCFIPDARDANYPIRRLSRAELDEDGEKAIRRGWRTWNAGPPYLDQGASSACVGFAWTHWLIAGPLAQRAMTAANAMTFYQVAKTLDEWPGSFYEGTSVRGGAKALAAASLITEYRWASSVDDVVHAVLTQGPVVVGTDWHEGMDDPDPEVGIMRADGALLGGHAYLIVGVNRHSRMFRVKNSWGRGWCQGGRAWLPFADFAALLSAQGEACLAIERRA